MKDLISAIKNIATLDELYAILEEMHREIGRITSTWQLSPGELAELAQDLARMRQLLNALAQENSHPRAGRMMALYSELEGRIKELRNDASSASSGNR